MPAVMEPSLLKRQPIEPQHYRDAMACYAGHVQVVTAESDGLRRGVTATAACSVSDSPATVLACINRHNERNAIFETSGSFALNTLAAAQQDIADLFSGKTGIKDEARFQPGRWDHMLSGAPTLIGAAAVFDCRVIEIRPFATHMILIGEVIALRFARNAGALLYFERHYETLDAQHDNSEKRNGSDV